MADTHLSKNGIYPTLPTAEPDNYDPENRDPHNLNKHLKLDFFNVIGEPDQSAYNFELLHTASNKVYQYSKLIIYRLLAILLGLPLMLFFGIAFGAYTFAMIWIFAPCRRLCQSVIAEIGIYIQTASDAVVAPLYRSFGQVWSGVRISLYNQQIEASKQIQV